METYKAINLNDLYETAAKVEISLDLISITAYLQV